MPDIDVNAMIWGFFMSATTKAAENLGQDDQENLRTTKNTDFEQVKQLFDISQKLDPESKRGNIWDIYTWLAYNSMDDNYFATRQSRRAVESKGTRSLWFGTLSLQNS